MGEVTLKHSIIFTLIFTLMVTGCAGSSASSTAAVRPSVSVNPGAPTGGGSGDGLCVDTTSASARVRELREELCELTNLERSKIGVAPLDLESDRSGVAQAHAEDMARNNYFSHTSPTSGTMSARLDASGISYSTAGENIARNSVVDAQTIMNQWMSSSGHKANILKRAYGRLGIGYASGRWVQVFTN